MIRIGCDWLPAAVTGRRAFIWTPEHRPKYDRSKLRYPSDLTNEEWLIIGPLIPDAKGGGNKRTIDVGSGRVARPFGSALTDPGRRLSGTRLFSEVTRIMPYVVCVSTRRVDELVQATRLSGISKSTVSKLCKDIAEKVLAHKPGALRNGAPFKDWLLPAALAPSPNFASPWLTTVTRTGMPAWCVPLSRRPGRNRPRVMHRALTIAVAALLLSSSMAGAARTRRAARASLRTSRIDALLPPEESRAAPRQLGDTTSPPAWTLDLLAPFFFNSNPATLEGSPHPGWETHPGVRLGWTRRSEVLVPLRWDALVDSSADRFRRSALADADTLLGRLRVQYESGRDDQEWQPFLSFQPARDYTPGLRQRLETRHDLAAGASVQLNLDRDLRRLPPMADSAAATVWSLSLNASVQRRWAAPFPTPGRWWSIRA